MQVLRVFQVRDDRRRRQLGFLRSHRDGCERKRRGGRALIPTAVPFRSNCIRFMLPSVSCSVVPGKGGVPPHDSQGKRDTAGLFTMAVPGRSFVLPAAP